MYKKSSIGVFLIKQGVNPSIISNILLRIGQIADMDGFFSADKLEEVMGQELAQAYREACACNPSLMLAQKETVPHNSRRGLGIYQEPTRTFF